MPTFQSTHRTIYLQSLGDILSDYTVKNSAHFVILLTKERIDGNKATVLFDAESWLETEMFRLKAMCKWVRRY